MIERVAKALAWNELTKHGRDECCWEHDFSECERLVYRGRARAAIEAMREPTDAMLEAASDAELADANRCSIVDYWEAMIEEALK